MSVLDRLFRRDRPPAEALARLEPGERATAWGTTEDGQSVVATVAGLWLPGREQRLDWHDILKATWADGAFTIIPAGEVEPGVVVDEAPIRVRLERRGHLPAEVRTRVTKSVAYSTHQQVPGGGVRVVARRVAGLDGLTWLLRFDDGVDRADPQVRAAAAEVLDRVRAQH